MNGATVAVWQSLQNLLESDYNNKKRRGVGAFLVKKEAPTELLFL